MNKDGIAVRQSGNIGQEILGPDGRIVAWTTDAWIAKVIRRLLIENEELLTTKKIPRRAVKIGGGPLYKEYAINII